MGEKKTKETKDHTSESVFPNSSEEGTSELDSRLREHSPVASKRTKETQKFKKNRKGHQLYPLIPLGEECLGLKNGRLKLKNRAKALNRVRFFKHGCSLEAFSSISMSSIISMNHSKVMPSLLICGFNPQCIRQQAFCHRQCF